MNRKVLDSDGIGLVKTQRLPNFAVPDSIVIEW